MKKTILLFIAVLTISFSLSTLNCKAQWAQTSLDSTMVGTDVIYSLTASGNNIYACTYGTGVFKSTNNGATWVQAGAGLPTSFAYDIAISGIDVFAATNNGVYSSTINGSSWTPANSGMPVNATISALEINGSTIFAGSIGCIYKSSNNGSSWTTVSSGLPVGQSIDDFCVSGGNIFACSFSVGIFISSDNGNTWTQVNNGLPSGTWVTTLAAVGTDILAGTYSSGIYKTSNNGANWTAANNGIPTTDMVRSMVVSGNNVFAGLNGHGVYLSANNGNGWIAENTGLTPDSLWSVAVSGTHILAGFLSYGVWIRPLSDFNTTNSSFSGKAFNDANNNGIKDIGEYGLPNVLVQTKSNGWVYNTDLDGNFNAYSPLVSDTIQVINPSLYSTASPSFYPVTDLDTGKNFAIYFAQNIQDLRITITPITAARPGFNDVIYITYKNTGTITMSGNVTLNYPSNINYLSSVPVQSGISGSTISWNFTNLLPFEQRIITATLNLPSTVTNGSYLVFTGTVNPIAGDTTPGNNINPIEQLVTASIDPNEKEVIPANGFTPQQLAGDEKLVYTVHFQNTGTDTAFTVKIIDTLSQNLDASTFEILASSHPCTFGIHEAGIVEFTFPNILLPDSNINLIGSNGFVKYTIKPKANLLIGDSITNTAYIYFDFNLPVATNTTSTFIRLNTGIPELLTAENKLLVFPNPATDNLSIITPEKAQIDISNVEGQLIKSFNANEKTSVIDISDFADGLYFIKAKTDNAITIKKFVKE